MKTRYLPINLGFLDKNDRHIRAAYRESLKELLIPKGFTEDSINLIWFIIVEMFGEFTPIDLTNKKRVLKNSRKDSSFDEVRNFDRLVQSDDSLNYVKFGTVSSTVSFKNPEILKLIKRALFYLRTDLAMREIWSNPRINQALAIQRLGNEIHRLAVTKSLGNISLSRYSQNVLVYDILKQLGFIIDDGLKSNSDKSAFMYKYTNSDKDYAEIDTIELTEEESEMARIAGAERELDRRYMLAEINTSKDDEAPNNS